VHHDVERFPQKLLRIREHRESRELAVHVAHAFGQLRLVHAAMVHRHVVSLLV
jgi:hypothetical protein